MRFVLILIYLVQTYRRYLFSEEKGVVAEGYLKDRNFFEASKILAKHDENYMPPEVKESMEQK